MTIQFSYGILKKIIKNLEVVEGEIWKYLAPVIVGVFS